MGIIAETLRDFAIRSGNGHPACRALEKIGDDGFPDRKAPRICYNVEYMRPQASTVRGGRTLFAGSDPS